MDVKKNVDLERSEDRFIIYVKDTSALVEAFEEFTDIIEYPETPVTQTIYMGDSVRGLPPQLSIKARTYSDDRFPGRWEVTKDTEFSLLELKKTMPFKSMEFHEEVDRTDRALKFFTAHQGFEEVYEVLSLASESFKGQTLKSKKRTGRIKLEHVLRLLGHSTDFADVLTNDLYVFLLENIHPLEDFDWAPLTATEYRRTHFKTKDKQYNDSFRATLDMRVTHYSFMREHNAFIGVPVSTENFSRLEIKADYERLKGTPLGNRISEIILNFRAFRIPSKKYRGLTMRGHRYIEKFGFINEVPGKKIYAFFPARPIRHKDREHYVNLSRYIQTSGTFHILSERPVLLEEHVNTVSGVIGALTVNVTGDQIIYTRPDAVKRVNDLYIVTGDRTPVAVIPIESRDDLSPKMLKKLKDKKNEYVRSKGFLVEHKKSKRVYKVSLERKIFGKKKMEDISIQYMGREGNVIAFDVIKRVEEEISALSRFLRKYPLMKSLEKKPVEKAAPKKIIPKKAPKKAVKKTVKKPVKKVKK